MKIQKTTTKMTTRRENTKAKVNIVCLLNKGD